MIELLAIAPPSGPVNPDVVDAWVRANIGERRFAVLLREPGATPDRILDEEGRLGALRTRCRERDIDVIIGCDFSALGPDISKRIEACCQGVQLRGDPSVAVLQQARTRFADILLGRSCHGQPQPGHARVDYTCFAPVFEPRTIDAAQTKRAAGLEALRAWTDDPEAHVIALGGVQPDNAVPCLQHGARGLASIRTFFGDPGRVSEDVRALVEAFRVASHVSPPSNG